MFVSFVVHQLVQREQSRIRPSPSNRPSIGQWPVLLFIKYFDACSQPRVCDSFIQLVSLMNQPKTYTYSHAYTQHNWYTFSTHLYWLSGLSQWLPVMALVCFIGTAWTIQGFCMQVFSWTNEFISSCISSEHCCFILTQSQARFMQGIAKMRKMCYLVLVISFGLCSNDSLMLCFLLRIWCSWMCL